MWGETITLGIVHSGLGGQRLDLEDVERRAGDRSGPERLDERGSST